MSTEIFRKIQLFTSDFQGLLETDVKESSSLQDDLGIYGDDAVDYVIAYGKTFNVDVSKFMAADYFSGEGDFILSSSNKSSKSIADTRKNLKISHLVTAVEMGRLDEEVINSITS
jgi:hypothetical protein